MAAGSMTAPAEANLSPIGLSRPDTLVFVCFCLVGSLAYLAVLTNGTFDLDARETLDRAYDAYARALLAGRLDVSRDVIGNEGFYIDGKVYLYYGILPALLRLPFLLANVESPGPRLFVWIEAAAAATLFHLTLARILSAVDPPVHKPANGAFALMAGIAAWIASPCLLLVSNASIYHEPIGVALVCIGGVLLLLSGSIASALSGQLPQISTARLTAIAALSGLSLHARPPLAVGLFLLTGLLCLWTLAEATQHGLRGRLLHAVCKSLLPGAILAIAVAAFLFANWLRFGDPMSAGPLKYYGYYLFLEGNSPRMQTFFEQGRFQLLRLIPNALVHALGIYQIHEPLTKLLRVGAMRLESPLHGLLLIWAPVVIMSVFGARYLVELLRRRRNCGLWLAGIGLALSASLVIMLCYSTVTLRYKFEMWPALFFLSAIGLVERLGPSPQKSGNQTASRATISFAPVSPAFIGIVVLAAFYSYRCIEQYKSMPLFNGDPADSIFQTGPDGVIMPTTLRDVSGES